ncbi:MAG: NnrS family protein [Gammaproteobacteria bacterium]|jgi:uncharacterized protein involved in response to NO
MDRYAILNLGFRPFFAGAGLFSIASVLIWLGVYVLDWPWRVQAMPAVIWHGHEMIFGYGMAVVAGFLLTAVKNWTGVQTLHGLPLLLLFLLWLAARILLLGGAAVPLEWAAAADCLFDLLLLIAIACPVFRVRQFRQAGILAKVALLLFSNMAFYAGMLNILPGAVRPALYSGVYLILALIFVMSRRVLPFFIERGLEHPVSLKNSKRIDAAGLFVFLGFWIADVLTPDSRLVGLLAGVLCVLHAIRLGGWYAAGIMQRPLLWVLYLAYAVIVAGFALKAAVVPAGVSPALALHAFTYGGIGLFTLGMMARVTLGHTGRNILDPPPVSAWIFGALLAGTVLRVLLPLVDPQHYTLWIALSQLLWLAVFSAFLAVYLPMLVRPRVDGQFG